MPDILNEDDRALFVGIGTLINENLVSHKAHKKAIFSTGLGYLKGGWSPKKEINWKIYCLRGPLTAKALGLSEKLAVTDGGVLVQKFFKTSSRKIYKYSYMPHKDVIWQNSDGGAYKEVCESIGFGFIDPTWDVDKVISCILETEVLLTDAMHGAIVADCLRIPWLPLKVMPDILEFKWQDWCMAMDVIYKPFSLIRLLKPGVNDRNSLKLKNIKFKGFKEYVRYQFKTIVKNKPFLSKKEKIKKL